MVHTCQYCSGTGRVDTGRYAKCHSCHGDGQSVMDRRLSCPSCGGSGLSNAAERDTCSYCGGGGIDYQAQQADRDARQKAADAAKSASKKAKVNTKADTGTSKPGPQFKGIDYLIGLVAGGIAYGYLTQTMGWEPGGAVLGAIAAGVGAIHLWKAAIALAIVAVIGFAIIENHQRNGEPSSSSSATPTATGEPTAPSSSPTADGLQPTRVNPVDVPELPVLTPTCLEELKTAVRRRRPNDYAFEDRLCTLYQSKSDDAKRLFRIDAEKDGKPLGEYIVDWYISFIEGY